MIELILYGIVIVAYLKTSAVFFYIRLLYIFRSQDKINLLLHGQHLVLRLLAGYSLHGFSWSSWLYVQPPGRHVCISNFIGININVILGSLDVFFIFSTIKHTNEKKKLIRIGCHITYLLSSIYQPDLQDSV